MTVSGLYPLLSEGALPLADFPPAARMLADLGVSVLQVRLKGASDRQRLGVQRAVADALTDVGFRGTLVVNDRADLARVLADEYPLRVGLHLGQDDLPPRSARDIVGPDVVIGLSTHDAQQLALGLEAPVDYLAFGPIFATATKAKADPVVGVEGLAAASQAVRSHARPRPLVAIGGLDPARAKACAAVGADAWAVAQALFADGLVGMVHRVGAFA
ncbi:MAG: thiamine phosphate synthase [Myxococcota bacterium]